MMLSAHIHKRVPFALRSAAKPALAQHSLAHVSRAVSAQSRVTARPTRWSVRRQLPTFNAQHMLGQQQRIGVPCNFLSTASTAPSVECQKIDQTILLKKCQALKDSIVACNWSDTYKLVENVPFWETAMNVIEEKALILDDHIDAALLTKVKELQKLMDCLYIVEDVRDHINELHMHLDRATGIAGTGVYAHPTVENIDEHLSHLTSSYESIRLKYKTEPTLLMKVDEVVGGGLAVLRQKKRFDFSTQNKFYY